jgi:ATP-dependent Clp protease ATP-binding subunit ClpC
MFERFTRGARRCVEAALEEAGALGHDSVGSEDLLLGVLRADDGVAAEALRSLGMSLEGTREEVRQQFVDALASIGISVNEVHRRSGGAFETRTAVAGRLPFSPRAKKALEQALREARRLGHKELTGEHILLGLLRDEHDPAVRTLTGLGVSAEAVESRLQELRQRG